MLIRPKPALALAGFCAASTTLVPYGYAAPTIKQGSHYYQHVLILSVDGLHEADIQDPKLQPFLPNILKLEQTGVSYTRAYTSKPSDSFPGTLAYLTGASPRTTGVYYDDAYDRRLTAPGGTTSTPHGTEVLFDETIDKNPNLLSGGGNYGFTSINPAKLPLKCTNTSCQPFYPFEYPKVNTIFDVAHKAGLYTAFSDKHSGAYTIAEAPKDGTINDLYNPEIAALVAIDPNQNNKLVDASDNVNNLTLAGVTSSYITTEAYDDLKVKAIINEIDGKNSLGNENRPVPALFAMNFQAVSVAEKSKTGGIDIAPDGTEQPSAQLISALRHTDRSIGKIVEELQDRNLLNTTLVVLTAKHGQNPRVGAAILVKDSIIPDTLAAAGINVAQATEDDIALLWLTDRKQAGFAALVLSALQAQPRTCGGNIQYLCNPGIETVYYGSKLEQAGFGNLNNNRTPDLIVKLKPRYVLVGNLQSKVKRAEHGGLNLADTHVPLIVFSGGLPNDLKGKIRNEEVSTKQIAVTTLVALGINPYYLRGAAIEKTEALPDLQVNDQHHCESQTGVDICW